MNATLPIEDRILRITSWWLAVNKAAGETVEAHPELISLETQLGRYLTTLERKPFLGIVHRLDKVTSGVILFGRKRMALKKLNQQFAERKVIKTYLAIVPDRLPKDRDSLHHYLLKDFQSRLAVISDEYRNEYKKCQLTYQVLQRKDDLALISVIPRTGRYHQIRAQLAHIGCPVLGDVRYGGQPLPVADTIALHSNRLSFQDPRSGEPVTVSAPLPESKWWSEFEIQA